MQHLWTFLAACLFAIAIAMVVFRHGEPQPPPPAAEVTTRSATRTAGDRSTHHRPLNSAATTDEAGNPIEPVLEGPNHSLARPNPANTHPGPFSHAELEQRAESVDREANHELARLIPLLELGTEQQQRVFEALARTSPSFVPGMMMDGAPLKPLANTPQQTLLAELSTAQIAAYLQDSNERSAWWSEYISGISSQLNNGTPAVSGSSAAATASTPATTTPAGDTTAPAATVPPTKDAHTISGNE